jgi:hypothetical protein
MFCRVDRLGFVLGSKDPYIVYQDARHQAPAGHRSGDATVEAEQDAGRSTDSSDSCACSYLPVETLIFGVN